MTFPLPRSPSRSLPRAICAVLAAIVAACDHAPPPPVVFEGHAIDRESARPCGSLAGCTEIHLSWLEAGGGSPKVTARVNATVYALLRFREDEPTSANTPDLIAQAFQKDFQTFRRDNPGDTVRRWTLMTAVAVAWRSPNGLVTLDAPTFRYQGGAHPVSQERFRVIDLRDGRALAAPDILADAAAATMIVERFFRRAKGVPPDESLSEYGWNFEHDRFVLPPDIGLNADGVIFHWDPSVIGPYVAGMTTIVVPYDSLRSHLTRRVLP